jgi:hypothetical protein
MPELSVLTSGQEQEGTVTHILQCRRKQEDTYPGWRFVVYPLIKAFLLQPDNWNPSCMRRKHTKLI